jgi:hypothetical protein
MTSVKSRFFVIAGLRPGHPHLFFTNCRKEVDARHKGRA